MIIYAADSNKILIDKITEEIAKKSVADMSQRFFLIVPEKFSVSMEKLMLLKSKRKALTNVQVTTLSRLLHKLNDGTKNYIPKQTGVMIVKKIILDNYDKLVCYKKTARTMGFAEKIYDTISELKNSKVSPLDYLKQRSGLTTTLNIKLQDIFLIYSEYEKFITTNKLIDACDRFELLSSLILSSDKLRGSYVYVLGFDSVTSAGLSVFESIAKVSKQTTFACLDNSGKANSYICRPEMLENYKDMAKRLGVSPTIVSLRYPKLSMAQHICNNVYSYPYSRIKTTDEVILFETKTVIEEIELLAENIRRRVIEDGLRYNEIAIVCPDVDGYQNIIKNTFADYKIPFFIDSAEPLANHPLVIFLENCLNCIRKNFSVDEFMLVASSYFSGLTTKEVSCLDNFLVKYGVNYDKLKEPFNKALKQSWEENDSLSERARSVVANALLPAYNALIKSKKVSCHIDVVKSLFDSFCLNDKVEDFIELLKREKNHVLSDATKQVREKVINLLSEIERIFGKQEMPFDEFFAIFQSGIQGEKISLVPIAVDMVFVGDISTSKFFDVKDLYIIGAVDGSVPKIKDDCGIIVDKEVNMLSDNLGKKIEPTIRTINQREKFKLVNILQEFSERLYISYSKLSRSGEQQQPSSIIREISKIFYRVDSSKSLEVLNASRMDKLRSLLSEKDLVSSYAYEYATKEVGLKKLLTSVSEDSSNKESMKDVAISSLYNVLKKDKQINVEACLTPRKDRVLSEPKQLFFNTGKTSVSQIECYYSCPFRYFASYGLRVRPREEAYLKSIDFGNVLHKIAELYIKNINKFEKLSTLSTKEEMQKEIEKLIDFVFNQEKIKREEY